MAETGFCLKCKTKKEMKNAQNVTLKNGRLAIKGECPECNTKMCKILASK